MDLCLQFHFPSKLTRLAKQDSETDSNTTTIHRCFNNFIQYSFYLLWCKCRVRLLNKKENSNLQTGHTYIDNQSVEKQKKDRPIWYNKGKYLLHRI